MKKILLCALSVALFATSASAITTMPTDSPVPVSQKKGGKKALAEDFKDAKLVTLQGEEVSLSDYVGKHKYVLVDFWASWCGPCMREMPNVKAAYEKYKSRGLEVVGISLDKDKAAWEVAVKRVGITWPQMTDMGANGSNAASLYGVQYIPYIVVFDKKGNIVAKNLHGEGLLNKLEELMPSKK